MAKLITEDQKSRTIDMNNGGGTSERFYTMKDYTEADDAYKALLKYAPETIFIAGFQMARTGVKVRPEFSDPLATLYRGSVSYASPTMGGQQNKPPSGGGGGGKSTPENQPTGAIQEPAKEPTKEDDPSKVYFTYGTRSTTVLNAIRQDKFFRWNGNFIGRPLTGDLAINRDADDIAPEGVQVQQGAMFMHVVTVVNASKLTPEFYKAIPERLMAINQNAFAYFDKRQVQFQGIDIEQMVSGDYKLEYHFEIRTPVYEKTFVVDTNGKTVKLTSKNVGWDGFSYTWLSHQDVTKKDAEPDDKSKIEYARSVDTINAAQVFPTRVWNNDIIMKYCKPPAGTKGRWKKG